MIGSGYIRKFNERIDPDAIQVGNFRGISKIMRNYDKQITYYIHWIEEFWYSFGRYYPNIGGVGISVAKEELENAVLTENPMIVITMPYKQDVKFYGLSAKTWCDFCNKNQTWNRHSKIDQLENGSIPAKLLLNLENKNKDKTEE